MSTLASSDEQRMLAENLRRLLSHAHGFETRRRRLRAAPPDRMALWPQLAEIGALGAAFPEVDGGYAGDARTVAVVMWELGQALVVEPYLASAVIAGRVLQHLADPSARAREIESLIGGERVLVLAHDSGEDPFGHPALTGRLDDGAVTLSGEVRCVRHADVAGEFLVSARIDGSTMICRVPRDAAGLEVDSYRLVDGAGGGDLRLRDVRLDADARREFDRPAAEVLQEAIEWGLLGVVAEASGVIAALNAATFAYLGSRKQFGAVIGSFQALQHRAADMYVAGEESFAMLQGAIDGMTHPSAAARSAILSAAKVVADRAGRLVGHESIQMHGGMGVSDELVVSHYARRLACIRAELGAADVHRMRFAGLR